MFHFMNTMALSVLLVGICLFTTAHTSDNGPEEFVLGFMYNPPASGWDGVIEVYVTSRSNFDIRGNMSFSTIYFHFIVYPLTSLRIEISVLQVMMEKSESRGQKGIVVNTNRRDVNVVGLTKQNGSSDGFMSIPTSYLGQVYRACVHFPFSRKSQIAVIGVKNNTSVIITLSANENAAGAHFGPTYYNPGDSITTTVNSLEVIAVQSIGDLSGTRVTADQNIAFFSGNSNTEVNGAGPGHLVEQLLPVNQWGKQFIVPSAIPNGIVTVKVISDTTCTTAVITKICTHFFSDTHEYFVIRPILTFEIPYQYNCLFRSDEPVMMVMYVSMSDTTKDPTMTIIPAIEHFDDYYAFEAPPTKLNSASLEIFLVLVVKQEDKNSLLLSGNSFSGSLTFDSVYGTSFVVGVTTIPTGYHTIEANGDFLAIILGIDVDESYSFPLGMDYDYPQQVLPMSTTIPGCSNLPSTSQPVTEKQRTTTDDIKETTWTGQSSSDLNSAADASTEPAATLKVTDRTVNGTTQTIKTTDVITTDETTTLKLTSMPLAQNGTIALNDTSSNSSTAPAKSTTELPESTTELHETTTEAKPTTGLLKLSAQSTELSTPTTAKTEYITSSSQSTRGVPGIYVSTTEILDSTSKVLSSTTGSYSDVSTPFTSSFSATTLIQNNRTCPPSCIVCKTIPNGDDGATTNKIDLERVNRKQTSRYKRTLISASDDRLSVMITGSVGGAILVGLFLGIVALDIDNLINMIRSFRGTVKARQKLYRGSNKKRKTDVNWC